MRLKLCNKFNTDHFRLAKFWVGPNCLKHFFIENWIIVTVLTLNYLTVLSFTSSFIAMRLKQRKIFLPKFFSFMLKWNRQNWNESLCCLFENAKKNSFLSRRRKKSTSFPPLKKISIEKKFALKKVFFLHSFSPKKSSWVGCCCCRGCCCRGCCCHGYCCCCRCCCRGCCYCCFV